jgi:hypothetical protein
MAIALIGAWTGAANTTGNTSWPTGTLDTTGGNFIVATVTSNNALTSVTDNKSNTYTLLGPFNTAGGDNLYIAYTNNAAAATCGTGHIITANATGSTFFTISAAAYSGLATSGVLDKSAHSNGTGTALSSGSTATTSQANILLIGAGTIAAGSNFSWTAGSGYTLRSSVGTAATTGTGFLEDQIVAATGAYSATATSGVSGGWDCAIGAFKDATAGGGGVPLTGQAAAGAQGTLVPATSKALSGTAAAGAQGTPGISISIALTGISVSGAQGTLSAGAVNGNLVGFVPQPGPGVGPFVNLQFRTTPRNTVIPSSTNVTVALTGIAVSGAQGALGPVTQVALSGQASASALGTLAPARSVALSGTAGVGAQGSLSASFSIPLTGMAAASAQGTVTPVNGIVVALTGIQVTLSQGTLGSTRSITLTGASAASALGSLTVGGGNMPSLIGLNYYMALQVLQDAGIYTPFAVYAFRPSQITVQWSRTGRAGGLVVSQSPPAGSTALAGQPITITVSDFPFGGVIDSPPDWNQRN